MISLKKTALRIGMIAAPLAAALALAVPQVTRAATTIVVDDKTTADNCGSYDGDTAQTSIALAINTAPNGSTIVVCPGTYNISGEISPSGITKMTIKRALTDLGDTPVLVADPNAAAAFNFNGSTGVTVDGLLIDGSQNTSTFYDGIFVSQSGLTLKNTGIVGPAALDSRGVDINNTGLTKALAVSITDCYIVGFYDAGVYARGAVKLTVTSSTIDGSDGGRVGGPSVGVFYDGMTSDKVVPTGKVTTSTISAQLAGVYIAEASKVTVSSNKLIVTSYGVYVYATGAHHPADNNVITANTILNVPTSGAGVYVSARNAATASIKKLSITSNTIIAAGFLDPGGFGPASGVHIEADASATKTVTPTVSKNTFTGFTADDYVVNVSSFAGLTLSANTTLP